MIKVDIAIFVEHLDREYDVAELLGVQLKARGFTVIILSGIFHLFKALVFIRPRAIITPSTNFGCGSPAYNYYSVYKNIKYYNLNYEQFISGWKGEYKNSKHPAFKNLQIQFVWGEFYKQVLLNAGVREENILITGRPYSDVIQRKYLLSKQQNRRLINNHFNLSESSKLVFIALTDGLGFVSEEKIRSVINAGAIEAEFRKHIEYVRENIKQLVENIRKLVHEQFLENENIIIVLRPHPSVPIESYESLLYNNFKHKNKNIIITKEFNALTWLSISDLFITNYSTLCLDSKNLKIPTVLYESFEKDFKENYWWTSYYPKIKNLADLKRYLLNENSCTHDVDQKEEYYISSMHYPINTIVNKISNDLQYDAGIITKSIQPINKIKYSTRRLFGSLLREVLMSLKIPFVKPGLRSDYFRLRTL